MQGPPGKGILVEAEIQQKYCEEFTGKQKVYIYRSKAKVSVHI